ncbi:MAG TPA: ATP-dependent helicase [Elusimicrobia bacterium]|nr:ATP-dependent helicase [Elusimicrobiota bacterium]
MTDTTTTPATGFYGLGIAPKLLEALDKLKFKVPTPIQHKAIPPASEGKDMVGIAQTGTGKTIAFAIPMIQQLAAKEGKGLVLVPTRELALQVAEVVKQFAPLMGMQTAVIIGGESLGRQRQELFRRPRIIIATPGRMIDHIAQRNVIMSDVRVLVLDEADRMFDMGFAPQINKIIATLPKERQTMLFSATMPDEIMKLASAHMKLPIRIEVARSGTVADKVDQELFIVSRGDKLPLLAKILDKYWGSVLMFVRTKHNAKKIAKELRDMKHSAAEIHSNRSLAQRREALEGFKAGKYRILVATDIAARGIDVTGIELVINYDLPDEDENYIHRIGRTGRAGQPGRAITFAAPDQGKDVRNIERLMRMPLPVSVHPDILPASFGFSHNGSRHQAGEKRRPGARTAPRGEFGARPPSQPQQEPQAGPVSHLPEPGEKNYNREPGPQARPRTERPPQGRGNFSRGPARPQSGGPRRGQSGPPREGSFNRGQRDSRGSTGPRGEGRPGYGASPGPRGPQGRPDARGDGRPAYPARPAGARPGPNRYGADPSRRGGIVSPSPYFEEPPRRPTGRGPRPDRPRSESPGKPASGNWFSRFLKKKKSDY